MNPLQYEYRLLFLYLLLLSVGQECHEEVVVT